ncbi:MAG: hypothetical protein GXC73_11735, partial [Chitinophagaceae bacterium]|nr:hypothetical protein [Chitinophagaceae bacterium]
NNYSNANNNSIASNNNNTPTGNNSGKTNNNTVTANTGNNNNTNKPTVNTKPNNNPQTNNTGNSNNNNQTSYSGGSNIGLNTTNYSKKLALIGMERYQYITALRNPRNDARSMSKVLRENGFEVIEVIDGGKEQLKNAIKEFGYKLASYQVGLFYYSGHGIQIDDQNYVIPVDANIRSKTDVKDECPSVSWVLRRMEDANTKLNIVILDACRNNPFQRSAFGSENSEGGLAAILPPDNTIISFATDPGSVASDGVAGTNGLYTGSLVKYIAMPNLQIENVFKLTGKEVKEKSGGKQKPWLNSNFYDIFYFK